MYHQHFGLQEPPFSIAVNPRYLYMSPRHRDALAHLLYGVGAGGGFILLTGEVGTGKTTLNRCLIEQLPDNADVAIVLNPALDANDLLATVCEELAIELREVGDGNSGDGGRPGLKTLTDALHRFLLENHGRGRKTVLIIDEAQHLDFAVLEQIRLLTNLETHDEKLLHIILIGQPELADKLRRPELRQLNQRITARYDLQPLTADETAAYIRHRLQVGGLPPGRELFPAALSRRVHEYARGIPRVINLLCDRMLLGAYGQGMDAPNAQLLRSAAQEVLGESEKGGQQPRWLPATTALMLMLALLALPMFFVGPRWLMPESVTPDIGEKISSVNRGNGEAQRLPSQPAAAAPGSASRSPSIAAVAPPASSSAISGATGSAGASVAVPVDDWLLTPRQGSGLMGALYDVAIDDADPCVLPTQVSIRCEKLEAETWDALLLEGRPLLLELRDRRRFAASALFLDIVGDAIQVAGPSGLQLVSLAELDALWTGSYWRYWQAPSSFTGLLKENDEGTLVTVVADIFAQLDQQPAPLTDRLFTPVLTQRVRLFQRGEGLQADGVIGAQTLRRLLLRGGADISAAEAAVTIEERSAAGLWP